MQRDDARRDLHRRLRRHNEIVKALVRSQATEAGDLQTRLAAITEAASQSMEVSRASIWVYADERAVIRALDEWDVRTGRHSSGQELRASDFAEYFAALETERVIVAHDACTDAATRCFAASYLRPHGITSMLDAPIRVGGRSVGVLCHEHVGPARQWSEEDQSVAANMADFVSLALEHDGRVRTEEALRRSQEELHQAHKMEAIGRLAGGVAHDFNNLMTAVLSYAVILDDGLPPESPLRDAVARIRAAADRACDVTRQLLAVSRRQPADPTVLDPNEVVGAMLDMLRRIIGEHVGLRTDLARDLGRVRADRLHIEQILLNLVVNARDAMPGGGTVTIRTRNEEAAAPASAVVVLEVEDTGVGMAPELQARIFEPFFTTKERGQGTGLGLSTVYGIVAQSGGEVRVRSAAGEGSSFTVRLPCVGAGVAGRPAGVAGATFPGDAGAATAGRARPRDLSALRGQETILMVEDDAELRALVRSGLGKLGYTVLAARDIDECLALCSAHDGPIDLLISDVVMPKATGPVVVERVRALRPGIPVLFVSGYPDDALVSLRQVPDSSLLGKPYTPLTMASRVRAILAVPRPRP